jgi:hypothetical protein
VCLQACDPHTWCCQVFGANIRECVGLALLGEFSVALAVCTTTYVPVPLPSIAWAPSEVCAQHACVVLLMQMPASQWVRH